MCKTTDSIKDKIKQCIKCVFNKVFSIITGLIFCLGCVIGNYLTVHHRQGLLAIIAGVVPIFIAIVKMVRCSAKKKPSNDKC